MNDLLTMREAADFLHIGYSTLRLLKARKQIPVVNITQTSKGVRFRRSDLEKYIAAQTTKTEEKVAT